MKKTLNAEYTKLINQKKVLHIIREKQCSRIEISHLTGLTRASISLICDNLLNNGLIVEDGLIKSNGGRQGIALKINKDYGVYGSIFITRLNYYAGIVDFSGNVLFEKQGIINKDDPFFTLNEITSILKSNFKKNDNILGIAICAPGPLDKKNGKLLKLANLNKWNNLQICKHFEDNFNCKCLLDNVSNGLGLAECILNNKCHTNYLELVIDDGFGSSIIKQDSINILNECELGHISVNMNGKRCDCGNIGCSELYVNEIEYKNNEIDFFKALSSVIITSYNIYKTSQVFIYAPFIKNFDEFKNKLENELKNKSFVEFEINESILKNKQLFIATNLFYK